MKKKKKKLPLKLLKFIRKVLKINFYQHQQFLCLPMRKAKYRTTLLLYSTQNWWWAAGVMCMGFLYRRDVYRLLHICLTSLLPIFTLPYSSPLFPLTLLPFLYDHSIFFLFPFHPYPFPLTPPFILKSLCSTLLFTF